MVNQCIYNNIQAYIIIVCLPERHLSLYQLRYELLREARRNKKCSAVLRNGLKGHQIFKNYKYNFKYFFIFFYLKEISNVKY